MPDPYAGMADEATRERWVFIGRGPHGVLTWKLTSCPNGSRYATLRNVTVAMYPERFWTPRA